jgi:uncharacterized protein
MTANLIVEHDVTVPMRDDVRLRADVFRPEAGGPFPVLVQRYPYSTRDGYMAMFGQQIAQQGYAVVVQSCRGRFGSGGDFYPFHPDVNDSYDTVEWAAVQPWSTGKVGMYGVSYSGMTQWTAAIARAPHLVCIAPSVCTWDWTIGGWYFSPGVLTMGLALIWSAQMTAYEAERRGVPAPIEAFAEVAKIIDGGALGDPGAFDLLMDLQRDAGSELFRRWPLRDLEELRELAPWFRDWCDHDDPQDEYWLRTSGAAHASHIDLPIFHVTGWHDYFTKGALHAYDTLAEREGQRLIAGPWNHNGSPVRADADPSAWMFFDFSPGTPLMQFFDHHLKGELPGYAEEPPVRLYIMGENVWRDEHEWPLARTEWTPYHLRDDQRLTMEEPDRDTPEQYVHDPNNPVPGLIAIGATFGDHVDYAARADRSDVLVFESKAMVEDTEITGPVRVELWASSSAPSTDFVATLMQVLPDGSYERLCQGVVRSQSTGSEPQLHEIDLVATAVLVSRGSRLRLDISSSEFPTFELNPGTGGRITSDTATAPSTQWVFHDSDHPSRLILPIVPRER